jgi:hypothetical protein
VAVVTVFIPSTRLTIQRGVLAADTFGDELPAPTVVASGVPAAVTEGLGSSAENTQTSFQPSDARGGVLELFTIRLRPGADVREDDRLVDERTGAVYQARAIYSPHPFVGLADVRVVAVRTGATSQAVNA